MTFEAMKEYQQSVNDVHNAAQDALLMALKNKGQEIENGRALLKQFLDNCKDCPTSVMEALRRSLNENND